jgi:hypothetical protein
VILPGNTLLSDFVLELLIAIHGLSAYPVPDRVPEVVLVSHPELERMACDGPCAVYGWFPGGKTIYLDDRLDPVHKTVDAGILVHELVHFLQQESGRFTDRDNCNDWVRREQEAYRVQNRWLRRQPAFSGPFAGSLLPPWRIVCEGERTAE